MRRIFIALLVVAVGWKIFNQPGQVSLGPGVTVAELPQQTDVSNPFRYAIDGYTIEEIAKFRIKAKVLSREDYYLGREADLSPTDLALGWGNMSDEKVLDTMELSQSNRFYYWRVDTLPIPRREIETSSANMHLIPANDSVKNAIADVRQGEVVEIEGSLVNVMSDSDGWRWFSSLTRDDTGRGACELIWVQSLRVVSSG